MHRTVLTTVGWILSHQLIQSRHLPKEMIIGQPELDSPLFRVSGNSRLCEIDN